MLITNVTGNFFLKENDTATEMHLAVQEVDGTPVDLSTASKVEVVIGTLEGRYLTKVPTLLDAPGEFTFGLDEGDMLPTGDNLLEVHIFDETNSKRVAPSKGHYKLKVQRTIGALGLTVTTYTLDYFLSEVNRILFGLPQLLERGEALADRMDVLIEESEQGLDEMYTATDASRTATTQSIEATTAAELATQAAQQATVEADAATAEAIQATSDADNATQASIAQTQAANDATSGANAATIRANTAAGEAEHQAFQAENAAQDANNATLAANTATDSANAASSRANTSAGRADTATTNANDAANAANTAATEANTARDSANLAASLADGIATELRGYDNAIATFSLETKYLKHQLVRSGGSTYKAKVETQGNPLPVAPARSNEWFDLVAEKGEKGDMGTGINILGKVGSVAELPASGVPGDAYLIGANIHIWDGDGWLDGGPIQGPQGEIGPQGEVGVGLQYSWNGSQLGVKRADESTYTYRDLKGAKGDKGDNAKIITLDFVIPATDATQVDGNLINVHDYIYDAAADSIQFYLNSRILYPGEDFEMEGGTFRLLNWTGYDDPSNVTFYIKVTRSVFNIDPEVSHATVVGALGYTPVDSATLTEHLLDRTLKHHVHHVAEVPTDLQNMGIMFKVDGSSSDVPGVTTNTDLMNRVVQAEQKFDTEISDVAAQLAEIAINVESLGAVGDGITDDTTAIQNAINTASSIGANVKFEGGKTYITGSLVPKPNVIIDLNGSTLKLKNNANLPLIYDYLEPTIRSNFGVVNGTLDCNTLNNSDAINQSAGTLWLTNWDNLYFRNIKVINAFRNTFNFFGVKNVVAENIHVKDCGRTNANGFYSYGFSLETSPQRRNTNIVLRNFICENMYGFGVHVRQTDGFDFSNLQFIDLSRNNDAIAITLTDASLGNIRNVKIKKANKTYSIDYHAIEINHSSRIVMDNVEIDSVRTSGILFGDNNSGLISNNVKLLNIKTTNTSVNSLSVNYIDGLVVENCDFDKGFTNTYAFPTKNVLFNRCKFAVVCNATMTYRHFGYRDTIFSDLFILEKINETAKIGYSFTLSDTLTKTISLSVASIEGMFVGDVDIITKWTGNYGQGSYAKYLLYAYGGTVQNSILDTKIAGSFERLPTITFTGNNLNLVNSTGGSLTINVLLTNKSITSFPFS